jgi:exodeoxyribonuclease VII large subunit
MFSRSAAKLGFMPQSGMSVICSGNIEVYEAGGVYQIIASEMIPSGIGAKFMQLNLIKEKLAAQGIFANENKKPLVTLPKKIAVVTSLGGAALQDVLNILKRRYPVAEVLVFSAQVQGEAAHLSVCKALKNADSYGCDVIILTRGGGSFEDLMPFNTEAVAVAVAQCVTPVISAVGHETDTTLADYAADKRAPTPSAAAEICSPTVEQMAGALKIMCDRLSRAYVKNIENYSDKLSKLVGRIKADSPYSNIAESQKRLENTQKNLCIAAMSQIRQKQAALDKYAVTLSALSPYRVLERGYTIVLKDGTAVTSQNQIAENDEIFIRFDKFAVKAKITDFIDIEKEVINYE